MFSDEFKKGASSFLKIEAGSKVVGVFAGAPVEFKSSYKLRKKYPLGLEDYPEDAVNKFMINVLIPKEGKFFPFIWENTLKTGMLLEAITKKYGMEYVYEISRTGTGKKTYYSILPERALTDAEKAVVKAVKPLEIRIQTDDDATTETE